MINTKFKKLAIGSVVGATLSLSVFAETNLQPLGSLNAENGVTVVSDTGKLPIESTYSYFGGDAIVTGDEGLAGLTLDNGGGVYVREKSSATVRQVNGEYVVELGKGNIGFSFEAGVPFRVMASGKVIQSAPGQKAVSGAVALNAKGEVVVRSINGDLLVDSETGQLSTVGTGETVAYAMSEGEGQLVPVGVTEGPALGSIGGLSTPVVIGGAALLAGGALAISEAQDDDDDGSPSR